MHRLQSRRKLAWLRRIRTIIVSDGVQRCAMDERRLWLVDLHARLLLLALDLVQGEIGLIPLQPRVAKPKGGSVIMSLRGAVKRSSTHLLAASSS